MTVPTATIGATTFSGDPRTSSCAATIQGGELVCGFDKVKSGSPPLRVTVVLAVARRSDRRATACLTTTGSLVDQGT